MENANWFRQNTKEIAPFPSFQEEPQLEQLPKPQENFMGKMISRTFSELKPFCRLSNYYSYQ